MNKVFKVIWSEARNAYVVVSEMAKSHGTKSCSTKKLLAMLIATGVMTCASVAPAMAANLAPNDTKIEVGKEAKAKGGDSVAIGNGAEAKAANGIAIGYESLSGDRGWGVAVGGNTQAIGTYSVALGQTAKVLEYEGIAIGHTSLSEGSGAIAIGKSTKAKGAASLAFGNDAKALEEASIAFGQDSKSSGNSSIAIGRQANATGQNSIAIGSQAVADKAESVVIGAHTYKGTTGTNVTGVGQQAQVLGDYSTAFGMAAQANKSFTSAIGSYAKATADNANAMGSYSTASADFSVALGTLSVADRTGGYVGLYAPEGTDSLTWRANGGAVSVGSATLTRQITNVAAGTEATDAVNVAQLQEATQNTAWHLLAEEEITKDVNSTTKINHGDTVHFQGTDDNITISKEETEDATVMHVALSRNLVIDSVQAGDFFMNNEKGIGFGGEAYITQNGLNANDKVITKVSAGVYNTDAVNVGQLKEVEEVAVNANKGWNLSTNGVATEATNVAPGEIVDFSGDKNISVSNDKTKVKVELNKDLVDIESISNGDAKLTLGGLSSELTNGQGASVKLFGDATIINGKVNVYNDGRIAGVAAGINDTDAVNVSQLKNSAWKLAANGVLTEAEDVKAGDYVDFNGDQNVSVSKDAKDGVKTVKVELNKDLKNIETISNGDAKLTLGGFTTELTNGQGASVKLFGDTTTINNAVTVYKDGRIAGVAAGINDNDAVNVSQLKAVGATANMGWSLATNGVATEATNVKPGDYVDFSGDKNISVSHDGTKVKVELNKDIDVNSVQTNALNSKYNLSVGTMAENGIMPFFVNSTGDFYAAHNKFHVDKDGNMNANSVQTNALNSKYNLSVGTANADGTVPFFVNSNGAFYAANGKLVVDKDGKLVAPEAELGKVTADEGVIGNVVLKDGVFYKHTALRDGELFVGDADGNYSQITTKGAKLGKVTVAADGKISGVAAGVADTDAVNVGQLKEAVEAGNTDTHIKPGEYGVGADNTVNMDVVDKNGNKVDTVTIKDVAKASDVGDVNNIASDIKNQDGSHTTVVDAVNNLNNKVGDLNYVEGGKGNYVTNGENTTTSIGKLDKALKDVADTAAKHTKVEGGNNITVTNTAKEGEAANYKVELNKDIDVDTVTANTVTTGQTVMNNDGVKVGTDVSLNKDGLKVGDKVSVSATAVTAGQTSINNDGLAVGPNTSLKADELKVDGKTYIDKNGLNANGMQITNVADGKENSDAVNVGQLKESEKTINNRIDGVENQVVNNTNRINKLGSRVNKVGAGAAALAALHPMDFDPDDKLTFSAGYGNYAGENAAAIGAYYRPDEKVMFSVAGTVGNGENMVNAGVSFALDRTNHVSNSRTALAREVIDLRGQLAVMGAKMAKMEKAFGMLDETKTKLFPDVPANHWAYEYIAKLAGNGYIEGYPDGNFGGDRLMTRYEFAAMLYRAIENGAALEEKIIKEFEPELGRIRVDRISGEDGDRDKIERVRVNDTKGERDHYGNKLAK